MTGTNILNQCIKVLSPNKHLYFKYEVDRDTSKNAN